MEDEQFTPQPTQDGSYTFFSVEFQETFHSSFGAKQEAEVRYIEPCLLKQLAQQKSRLRILDICYGLGYNTAAAIEAIWSINPDCQIEVMALEIAVDVPRQAVRQHLLSLWRSPIPELLAELSNKSLVQTEYLSARLLLGDARQTIKLLIEQGWLADAIFLDPFSPPKCPQLWTVEFIELVAQCLLPTGRLATYSCAAAVRTALLKAGLCLGSTTGAGRPSPGTIAAFEYKKLPDLSIREQEHLQTRGAVPYRDLTLKATPQEIISNRQQQQQSSNLISTSVWRKRWLKY